MNEKVVRKLLGILAGGLIGFKGGDIRGVEGGFTGGVAGLFAADMVNSMSGQKGPAHCSGGDSITAEDELHVAIVAGSAGYACAWAIIEGMGVDVNAALHEAIPDAQNREDVLQVFTARKTKISDAFKKEFRQTLEKVRDFARMQDVEIDIDIENEAGKWTLFS